MYNGVTTDQPHLQKGNESLKNNCIRSFFLSFLNHYLLFVHALFCQVLLLTMNNCLAMHDRFDTFCYNMAATCTVDEIVYILLCSTDLSMTVMSVVKDTNFAWDISSPFGFGPEIILIYLV